MEVLTRGEEGINQEMKGGIKKERVAAWADSLCWDKRGEVGAKTRREMRDEEVEK